MTPNLILFPGWGFSPMIMHNLAEQFPKRYQISIADLSEPFEVLRSRIPENSTLLGWSLGGLFALKLASLMSINKVILTASTPCFIQQEDWPGIDPKFFDTFTQELKNDCPNALKKFAYLQIQGMNDERSAYKQIKSYLSKISATSHLLNMLKKDWRNNLQQLKCHVHFILSKNDPLVPIAVADKIKLLKPDAQISILEDAGHASVLFNIEAILNHVN